MRYENFRYNIYTLKTQVLIKCESGHILFSLVVLAKNLVRVYYSMGNPQLCINRSGIDCWTQIGFGEKCHGINGDWAKGMKNN